MNLSTLDQTPSRSTRSPETLTTPNIVRLVVSYFEIKIVTVLRTVSEHTRSGSCIQNDVLVQFLSQSSPVFFAAWTDRIVRQSRDCHSVETESLVMEPTTARTRSTPSPILVRLFRLTRVLSKLTNDRNSAGAHASIGFFMELGLASRCTSLVLFPSCTRR